MKTLHLDIGDPHNVHAFGIQPKNAEVCRLTLDAGGGNGGNSPPNRRPPRRARPLVEREDDVPQCYTEARGLELQTFLCSIDGWCAECTRTRRAATTNNAWYNTI